jgi:N-methylhydantoinase B
MFKPVFLDDVQLGYLCCMIHHTDIGGRVPGGQGFNNREIYQEGLRIPPLKLYEAGKPNETLFRILEKAVRVPVEVLADLQSQVAAVQLAEAEWQRLVLRRGLVGYTEDVEELVGYTERLTRRAISELPDGRWSFTDYVDDDGIDPGPITIQVHVAKEGDEISVDFSGTSPQCKGSIQPVFATTKAMVYANVRALLGTVVGDIPNNVGYFRPIGVSAPEGSFVNPVSPAATAARGLGCDRISHALWGAFAQMAPTRVYACPGGGSGQIAMSGLFRSSRPYRSWVYWDSAQEPAMGGRSDKDGIDGNVGNFTNIGNVPIESVEMDYPLRILSYALMPDTEGAGCFRGGIGIMREIEMLADDTTVQVRWDRSRTPPWGLFGGLPSPVNRVTINPGRQKERVLTTKVLTTLNKGDVVRVEWTGAGGYGEPARRDPARVLWDVIEDKVSAERAERVYGVKIDSTGREPHVDEAATLRLRAELRYPTDAPVPAVVGGSSE